MLQLQYPGCRTDVSYHNHTVWSDGASSMEELCAAAKKIGLRELGYSDHLVIPPEPGMDSESWSMDPGMLDSYVDSLLALRTWTEREDFTIRIGLEVDFFFENWEDVLARLKNYPFDYLIGSAHYAGRFSIDASPEPWKTLTEEEKDAICRTYWEKMEGAARCGGFTFLGHLDLPKKFGFAGNDRYLPMIRKVLDAARDTHTGIELNTAGWCKACAEQYPSSVILREANLRKVPVVISADAHSADFLNHDFDRAEAVLREAGYL